MPWALPSSAPRATPLETSRPRGVGDHSGPRSRARRQTNLTTPNSCRDGEQSTRFAEANLRRFAAKAPTSIRWESCLGGGIVSRRRMIGRSNRCSTAKGEGPRPRGPGSGAPPHGCSRRQASPPAPTCPRPARRAPPNARPRRAWPRGRGRSDGLFALAAKQHPATVLRGGSPLASAKPGPLAGAIGAGWGRLVAGGVPLGAPVESPGPSGDHHARCRP